METMNRSLLVLALLFAALPAQAQDAGRRGLGANGMAIEQPAPGARPPRNAVAPVQRQRGDQYIPHDRAARKGGPGESGYGLDLMMSPRRPAPTERR